MILKAQGQEEKINDLEEDGRISIKQGTAFILEGRPYLSLQEVIFHQIIDFDPLYQALTDTRGLAQELEQTCSKFETVFDLKNDASSKVKKFRLRRRKRDTGDNPERLRKMEKDTVDNLTESIIETQANKKKTHPVVNVLTRIIQSKIHTNITEFQLEQIIKEELLKMNETSSTTSFATQVGKTLMMGTNLTNFWALFKPDLHFQRQVIHSMIKEILIEEGERKKEITEEKLCLAKVNGTDLISVRIARDVANEEERQRVQYTTYHTRDLRETEKKYEVVTRSHISKYEAEQLCLKNNMMLAEPQSAEEVRQLGMFLKIQYLDSVYL